MAGEDPDYVAWVRTLPCCYCAGRNSVEAHHRTGAGMARRAHDRETMPLCLRCHHDFHGLAGHFKNFKRADLRAWQHNKIEETLIQASTRLPDPTDYDEVF